jgi:hypothetical protein
MKSELFPTQIVHKNIILDLLSLNQPRWINRRSCLNSLIIFTARSEKARFNELQEAQGPGAQLTGSRQGRNRILKYV